MYTEKDINLLIQRSNANSDQKEYAQRILPTLYGHLATTTVDDQIKDDILLILPLYTISELEQLQDILEDASPLDLNEFHSLLRSAKQCIRKTEETVSSFADEADLKDISQQFDE